MHFLFRLTSHFFRIMWYVRVLFVLVLAWVVISALGISYAEKIPFGDALYFAFITGLTIGYGDIVVKTAAGRVIAVLIGFGGVLFTGMTVAAAIESIRGSLHEMHPPD